MPSAPTHAALCPTVPPGYYVPRTGLASSVSRGSTVTPIDVCARLISHRHRRMSGRMAWTRRQKLGLRYPSMLIAVGANVAEESVRGGRAQTASPGHGEDVLQRGRRYDLDPGGANCVVGGFWHHRDGGAILDRALVQVGCRRRGDRGFQHCRVESAELAAHELEPFEGAWRDRPGFTRNVSSLSSGSVTIFRRASLLSGPVTTASRPRPMGSHATCSAVARAGISSITAACSRPSRS